MLEEIGKILREERERQGKTLEDIHNALKISIHNLKAIEEGDLGSLPHPVYVKGFIKNYADFLGLDGSELSQRFFQTCEMLDKDKDKIKEFESTGRKKIFWVVLLLCVFVIFLFGLTYIALKSKKTEKISSVSKQNIVISKKDSKESSKPVEKKDNIKSSNQVISSVASENNKKLKQKKENLEEIKKEGSTKKASSINLEHELKISAFEPCWLRAEIDGKTKEYYLKKGDVLSLKFKKSLKVKLGNAGGVSLEYDGEKIPLKAKSGEVRIIGFP